MSDKPKHDQHKGPHSSEHSSGKDDLGFDPDSPDLDDPQVDPTGPAIAPKGGPGNKSGRETGALTAPPE